MKTYCLRLLILGMLLAVVAFVSRGAIVQAQQSGQVWLDVDEDSIRTSGEREIIPTAYRTLALDQSLLQERLAVAPLEAAGNVRDNQFVLSLPMPDGSFDDFSVVESPIMEAELAAQFPAIKTYMGQGIDDPTATTRFDVTPAGFHAVVFSAESTIYIDPYSRDDSTHYISYNKRDAQSTQTFREGEIEQNISQVIESDAESTSQPPVGNTLRVYRLAVAATGEYTAFHGGTVAAGQAAIVTAINRVTGIYEREVAVRMVLVANNNQLVYTNAGSDPYTNGSPSALLTQNQANIDSVIGSANYDVGHVFSTGGGGLAALGVICSNNSKARGETGLGSPINDPFYVDYVAHELGHQFAGNHTFNGNAGNCSGGNRNGSTAYEPGSGSTIQAYAGICGSQNLQSNSDDYFHTISYDEIRNHTRSGGGSSCGTNVSTGNQPPIPNVGVGGFTIPANTPFELTGSATDPDGDALTYNWEQFDRGPASAPNGNTPPFFRSWPATTSPTRTFPRLNNLLNNTTVVGENLPLVSDTLNFRLTVRDNQAGGGGVDYDTLTFDVSAAAGPFRVTAPNSAATLFSGVDNDVTWDVANTDSAPVSCPMVDILLSTDGGQSFPTMLLAATPNDGSEMTPFPSFQVTTTTARIKIKCSNSVFFDVSNVNFTIDAAEGFAVNGNPSTQEICVGDDAQYTLSTQGFGPFNALVTLSAPNAPGTALFVPSSGMPPYDSTLTVSGAAVGNYTFNAEGTDGEDVEIAPLELTVYAPPSGFAGISPIDGTTFVSIAPELVWQSTGAASYFIEIATDAAFNNVVESAMVATTSYVPTNGLNGTTTYYWRVRVSNLCGSAETTAYSFTTAVNGFACGGIESFESGIPADWTVVNAGGAGWQTTAGSLCGSGSFGVGENYAGTGAAACADSDAESNEVDTYLCSPAIDLQTFPDAEVGFRLNYQVESPSRRNVFDVLVSTVAPAGPYGATLFEMDNDFPSSDVEGQVGLVSAETVSLSDQFGEETVYICFHYAGASDLYAHLDDVSLSCEAPAPTAVAGVQVNKHPSPLPLVLLLTVAMVLSGVVIVLLRRR